MKKILAKIKNHIKKSKGIVIMITMCFVAVALCYSFFVYSVGYTRILPNIRVEDIKIGGMTTEEAERRLENKTYINTNRQIVFECEGKEKTIDLSEFDILPDFHKSVMQAFNFGREGGNINKTIALFKLAFKAEELPLAMSMDEKLLDELISEFAKDKEIPAVSTHYKLDGDSLTIVRGHGGKMVDREKAAMMVIDAALDPKIKKISLEIETVKEEKVDLDRLYADITAPMKNAEYSLDDSGEVVIVPEKMGITVEKSLIKEALDSNKAEYTLTVKTQNPEFTEKDLKELLFRDVMGSWSSNFATSTEARAKNVTLTAQRINNKILMPGDVFSYDQTIGKRTLENGFREAGVYIGNKVESGIGGGICQTSSTLYSAALYANLEIVSRTSHSLPVSYMPAGQDATIAEGYIDLKIKNNTQYPIKILAKVEGRRLTCSILGVKEPDIQVELIHTRTQNYEPEVERTENPEIPKGYRYITNKGAAGYAVASTRIVKKAGEIIKTEKLTRSVYRAAPIEEEVNPLDKDTPSEQLKIYTLDMVIPKEENIAPREDAGGLVDETNQEQEPGNMSEENAPEGNLPEEIVTEENTI